MFSLAPNSIQSPTSDGYRSLPLRVTMPESEGDYSPPHSPKVKVQRALPRIVQYAFVYWWLNNNNSPIFTSTCETYFKRRNENIRSLTLRLLISYIYGAPSKARIANVVYIWTYVWQR